MILYITSDIKLDGDAPLVKDPPRANSTSRQNPPICNPALYIASTFEPITQLNKYI